MGKCETLIDSSLPRIYNEANSKEVTDDDGVTNLVLDVVEPFEVKYDSTNNLKMTDNNNIIETNISNTRIAFNKEINISLNLGQNVNIDKIEIANPYNLLRFNSAVTFEQDLVIESNSISHDEGHYYIRSVNDATFTLAAGDKIDLRPVKDIPAITIGQGGTINDDIIMNLWKGPAGSDGNGIDKIINLGTRVTMDSKGIITPYGGITITGSLSMFGKNDVVFFNKDIKVSDKKQFLKIQMLKLHTLIQIQLQIFLN